MASLRSTRAAVAAAAAGFSAARSGPGLAGVSRSTGLRTLPRQRILPNGCSRQPAFGRRTYADEAPKLSANGGGSGNNTTLIIGALVVAGGAAAYYYTQFGDGFPLKQSSATSASKSSKDYQAVY
jgi:hypothetical protein